MRLDKTFDKTQGTMNRARLYMQAEAESNTCSRLVGSSFSRFGSLFVYLINYKMILW